MLHSLDTLFALSVSHGHIICSLQCMHACSVTTALQVLAPQYSIHYQKHHLTIPCILYDHVPLVLGPTLPSNSVYGYTASCRHMHTQPGSSHNNSLL